MAKRRRRLAGQPLPPGQSPAPGSQEFARSAISSIDSRVEDLKGPPPRDARERYNTALGGGTLQGAYQEQRKQGRKLQRLYNWNNLTRFEKERIAQQHGYDTAGGIEGLGQPTVRFNRNARGRPGGRGPQRFTQGARMADNRPADPVQIKAAERSIMAAANEPEKQAALIRQFENMAGAQTSEVIQSYSNMLDTNTLPMSSLAKHEATILTNTKLRIRLGAFKDTMSTLKNNEAALQTARRLNVMPFYEREGVMNNPQWQQSQNKMQQLFGDLGDGQPNKSILAAIGREMEIAQVYAGRWAKQKDMWVRDLDRNLSVMSPEEQAGYMQNLEQTNPWMANNYRQQRPFGAPPRRPSPDEKANSFFAAQKQFVEVFKPMIAGLGDSGTLRTAKTKLKDKDMKQAEFDAIMAPFSKENLIRERDEAVDYTVERTDGNRTDALHAWNQVFNMEYGGSGVFAPKINGAATKDQKNQNTNGSSRSGPGLPGADDLVDESDMGEGIETPKGLGDAHNTEQAIVNEYRSMGGVFDRATSFRKRGSAKPTDKAKWLKATKIITGQATHAY